jgi:putative membrane protein
MILHTHHGASQSFWVSCASIFAALVYLRGCLRLGTHDQGNFGKWRVGSFLLGLFLIWLAIASPIAALDHELLTVHMVQHLLLMTLAPPLIWLAAPLKPMLYGLPQAFGNGVSRFVRRPLIQRLSRAITHPALCWLAAAAALVGWHVPSLFALGMRSELWHTLEQVFFLASGLLFWWPVIQAGRRASYGSEWPILLYLFLATLPCDILSSFLVFCDRVVYPTYFASARLAGFSALEDQQCAGALMWTCVTLVYLAAGTIFAARLLSPDRWHQYRALKSDQLPDKVAQTIEQSMGVV